MTIEDLYRARCRTPHNIDQHLPVLRALAEQCESVVELGTDIGFSTTAFLAAQPARLDCYDVVRRDEVDALERLAGATTFQFHLADSRTVWVPVCELLFIDTEHTYEQVTAELWRHAPRTRRFIVLHDIVSCPVIVPAITDYLDCHPEWAVAEWLTNQSGLAVLRRNGG